MKKDKFKKKKKAKKRNYTSAQHIFFKVYKIKNKQISSKTRQRKMHFPQRRTRNNIQLLFGKHENKKRINKNMYSVGRQQSPNQILYARQLSFKGEGEIDFF